MIILLKLKEYRKYLNFKQKDVAEKMNVTVATYSRWESGKINPRTEKLKSLAKILNCSVVDLLPDK